MYSYRLPKEPVERKVGTAGEDATPKDDRAGGPMSKRADDEHPAWFRTNLHSLGGWTLRHSLYAVEQAVPQLESTPETLSMAAAMACMGLHTAPPHLRGRLRAASR